mmetsp:Transcript_21602/g.49783  ORF Transcript_21602/g.49783 Transcript_21602/m.49783 type:complete len:535 (-) Transcript_21602:57-1661(-)
MDTVRSQLYNLTAQPDATPFPVGMEPPPALVGTVVGLLVAAVALLPAKWWAALKARVRWWLLPRVQEDTEAYNSSNHRHLLQLHEKLGDVFVANRRGKAVLFARSPTAVRSVLMGRDFAKVWKTDEGLTSQQARPKVAEYVHNLIQPLLSDPVFSQKGAVNKDARTLLSPLFAGSQGFLRGFEAEITSALAAWPSGEDGGVEVDVLDLTHGVIRRALYHAIAGPASSSLHAKATPAFHEALEYFVQRYEKGGHQQDLSVEDEAMMEKLLAAALGVVQEYRALVYVRDQEADDSNQTGPKGTMLATMLDAGCTDEQAASVLVNLVIAGAEAPASALAHTLQHLGRDTDVQQQLRDEVNASAAGAEANGAGALVLGELPYNKACVLEGLRMFAPATLVKRQALCDTFLDVGGSGRVLVPANTVVELCVTAIHHDPHQFENPGSFNPDRVGNTSLGKERCFMPFSGGLRGCPGREIAVTMMRIALAKVVQEFDLRAIDESKDLGAPKACVRKFVEWPLAGLPLVIGRRLGEAKQFVG